MKLESNHLLVHIPLLIIYKNRNTHLMQGQEQLEEGYHGTERQAAPHEIHVAHYPVMDSEMQMYSSNAGFDEFDSGKLGFR